MGSSRALTTIDAATSSQCWMCSSSFARRTSITMRPCRGGCRGHAYGRSLDSSRDRHHGRGSPPAPLPGGACRRGRRRAAAARPGRCRSPAGRPRERRNRTSHSSTAISRPLKSERVELTIEAVRLRAESGIAGDRRAKARSPVHPRYASAHSAQRCPEAVAQRYSGPSPSVIAVGSATIRSQRRHRVPRKMTAGSRWTPCSGGMS